jgi:membrane protein
LTVNLPLIAILRQTWSELGDDRIGLISAGIAFYGLLSLFPGIAALLALGGLMTEPQTLVDSFQTIGQLLPDSAANIILSQATEVAGSRDGGLGLAALIGFGLALYSSSKAVASLIQGVHAAYDETDDRSVPASIVLTLAMTLILMIVVLLAAVFSIGVPVILEFVLPGNPVAWLVSLIRWPILAALTALALGILYRFSLRHRTPRVHWVTPGAVLATLLWIAGSLAFSVYVQNFANYNETFGTLGGVVSLLMWMWLSAYIILFGAEVNSVIDAVRTERSPPANAPQSGGTTGDAA